MADAAPASLQPGLLRRAFGNRTGMGFLGAAALAVTATPRSLWLELGAGVAAIGAGLRLWASGTLEKNVRVARRGPYRLVRHPLYLGSTVLWLGLLLAGGNPWFAAPAAVAFAAYHVHAIRREERFLLERFGDEYAALRRDVPALVPWRSFWRLPEALLDGGCSARLALGTHREWHVPAAAAAFLGACAWFRAESAPPAARAWTAAALGGLLVSRLALFWLLDRDVRNPVLAALIAAVSRKKRRERAQRLRGQQAAP